MPMDEIEFECEEKMERAVGFFRGEVRAVRTGRASTALVEHVRVNVEAYGGPMDLRDLAHLSAPESSMIVVKPYDGSIIKDIERAIQNSEVGITPASDGKVIRLPVPPLSGERRQQLVTQVKKMAEAQRVAVRNARREANKQIDAEKKDGTLTEDDADRCKENVQDLTKTYEKQIDETLDAKTREIQAV